MRILVLQEELYEYLGYMVNAYARKGISPEEGQALTMLYRAVRGTPKVDEKQVARLAVDAQGNASVSTGEAPPEPPEPPAPAIPPAPDGLVG